MRKTVVQSVLFAGVVLSSAGQAADLDDVTMMVIRSDDKRLETITNRIQLPDRFSMRDRAERMDKEDKGTESTRSGHDRRQHGADSGNRSGERPAVVHDQKEQSREGSGEVRDISRDQVLEHKENISNSAQEHKDAAAAEIREHVESIQDRQESTIKTMSEMKTETK